MRIPACHRLTNRYDNWPLVRFVKWMYQVCFLLCFLLVLCYYSLTEMLYIDLMVYRFLVAFPCSYLQERYYVGRGMYERATDFIK